LLWSCERNAASVLARSMILARFSCDIFHPPSRVLSLLGLTLW
jgi:hypothetical protein